MASKNWTEQNPPPKEVVDVFGLRNVLEEISKGGQANRPHLDRDCVKTGDFARNNGRVDVASAISRFQITRDKADAISAAVLLHEFGQSDACLPAGFWADGSDKSTAAVSVAERVCKTHMASKPLAKDAKGVFGMTGGGFIIRILIAMLIIAVPWAFHWGDVKSIRDNLIASLVWVSVGPIAAFADRGIAWISREKRRSQ